MKKYLTISLLAFSLMIMTGLTACEDMMNCPECPAPKGVPDDTSRYTDGGYARVTYTYYCWKGKHRAVTYTLTTACGYWLWSEYATTCIK